METMWPVVIGLIFAAAVAAVRVATRKGGAPGSGGDTVSSTKLVTSADDARGVDVSAAQTVRGKPPDFAAVKAAGRDFVIVKLTDGMGKDGEGQINFANARAAGLAVSAYHYSSYANNAITEADHFADAIKTAGGVDFPPTLDFESVGKDNLPRLGKQATVQWALDFIAQMKKRGFSRVWLYSYPSYLIELMPNLVASGLPKQCDLWIADYSKGANPPPGSIPATVNPANKALFISGAWDTWVCWQTHGNDEKGAAIGTPRAPRIPGIGDAVDHDVFNGTVKQLRGKLLGLV